MLCECGCGAATPLITHTDRRHGRIAGEYSRFVRGHARRSSPVDYIVDPITGCWVWQLSTNHAGYGWTYFQGEVWLAHRAAYVRVHGPISPDISVLHECDNPPCVNPDHLFIGTQADNVADCVRKGRKALGEKFGRSKINSAIAAKIREAVAAGMIQRLVAVEFGVAQATVSRAVHRVNWD